jgi:hypothetical protein
MVRRIVSALVGGPPPKDAGTHSLARYRWLRKVYRRACLPPLVAILLGLVWGESSIVFWALLLTAEAGAVSGLIEYSAKTRRAAKQGHSAG